MGVAVEGQMSDSSPDGGRKSSCSSLWEKHGAPSGPCDPGVPGSTSDHECKPLYLQIYPGKTVGKSQCATKIEARASWQGIIWRHGGSITPFISTLQSLDLVLRHRDNTCEAESV